MARATHLAGLAKQMEACGRDGDVHRAAQLLAQMDSEHEAVCQALRRLAPGTRAA